jgi:hypothetical protein
VATSAVPNSRRDRVSLDCAVSRITETGAEIRAFHADARPNSRPVSMATPAVNSRTWRSIGAVISKRNGRPTGWRPDVTIATSAFAPR